MEKQLHLTPSNTNPSKALTALEKLNRMKERAREAIASELSSHERARQRTRFVIGQAILDDPEVRKQVVRLMAPTLIPLFDDYTRRTEEIAKLRSSVPR